MKIQYEKRTLILNMILNADVNENEPTYS